MYLFKSAMNKKSKQLDYTIYKVRHIIAVTLIELKIYANKQLRFTSVANMIKKMNISQ